MIQNHFLQNLTKGTKVKKDNLFFIKHNEIAVFRLKNIDESEKKLELLKNQGENFQTINSDFWTSRRSSGFARTRLLLLLRLWQLYQCRQCLDMF